MMELVVTPTKSGLFEATFDGRSRLTGVKRPEFGPEAAGARDLGHGGYAAPNFWTGGQNLARDIAWEQYKAMMTAPKNEKA
jgi:hypothetical protein